LPAVANTPASMKDANVTTQPVEASLAMSSWTVRAALEITQAMTMAALPLSSGTYAKQDSIP